MSVRKMLLMAAGLFAAAAAYAQFHSAGDDPGAVRWNVTRTAHYKLLYPRGMDSLAREYARTLEAFHPDEGRTIGYLPGEKYRRPLPVVLHPFGGESNGSVTWAPMRMDLFTLPDPYDPEPIPWAANLAVHESRHAAQMQFGADGLFRPFKWILGEMFAGALAGVYPNTWFLEGDAVIAETALTSAGRGRNGAFLAYYRTAFDQGDMRNWYRWRYGSYRLQAPNHYALGYMTLAGARYLYDDPLFAADYLHGAARRPWRFFNIQRAFRKASGKRFSGAFNDIMLAFNEIWTEDTRLRGPFTEGSPLLPAPSWYTTWSAPVAGPSAGSLVAKESSKIRAARLVSIDGGQVRHLRPFAAAAGALRSDGQRMYWSETVPDLRWSLRATSRIRYMEPSGKVRDLTRKGRLYNPAPSPDGNRIAVTEYPVEGGSRLLLLDRGGRTIGRLTAPDGIQFVESAWLPCCHSGHGETPAGSDILYFSYLNDDGIGIGRWDTAEDAGWETVLAPRPVSLSRLQGGRDGIHFISDRTGVGEVYRLTPQGTLIQLTATRYGAADFSFRGDTLRYTALTHEGELPYEAAPEKLLYKRVDFNEIHSYPVAEKLAAQEIALGKTPGPAALPADDPFLAQPKRYSKLAGIPHIHSWAPVWISYDRIESLSADLLTRAADIGATAFFQNLLGTASGQLGYSYGTDIYTGKRRHGGHLNLTYSGLYPVFEVTLDAGDRDLIQYSRVRQEGDLLSFTSVTGRLVDCPSVRAGIKMYVPLNFSKGGWNRGLIPQISYGISNDRFNKVLPVRTAADSFLNGPSFFSLSRLEPGENLLMQILTASVRGYATLRTPSALEYPRWGIGAEAGYHTRIGLDDLYSSSVYAYAYGYLPGIAPNQGLRLSMLWQRQNGAPNGENVVSTSPRGFRNTQLSAFLATYAPGQFKLTADYAVPVWIGDISWFSPLFYIRNFMVKPHADWLRIEYGRGLDGIGHLVSLGGEITARLANFLWLPYDTSVGVNFDWNGGPAYDRIASFARMERTCISGVFSISF